MTETFKEVFMVKEFFKLAHLSGNRKIREVVVDNGDTVRALSSDESVAVEVVSKTKVLPIDYPIGIKNLDLLVGSLTGNDTITVTDNRIIVKSDSRKMKLLWKEPVYISSALPQEKYETVYNVVSKDAVLTLPAGAFREIANLLSLTKNICFTLTVEKGGKVSISVGSENTDNAELTLDTLGLVNTPVSVVLGQAFLDVVLNINPATTIEVSLGNNTPALVSFETDDVIFNSVVALYGAA
jgi:hypothetical protein